MLTCRETQRSTFVLRSQKHRADVVVHSIDLTLIKLACLGRFAPHRGDGKFRGPVAVADGVGACSAARRVTVHAGVCFGRPRSHYVACEPAN